MKQYIFFFLIISNLLFAEYHFTYKKISTDEGLSNSTVNTIIQDKYGFIWIGTLSGLNKYNGYKFQNFSYKRNDPNTISGNRVYSLLYQPEKDLIWIGLFDGGLNRINIKNNSIKRYELKFDKKTSSGVHIRNIFEDRKGYIWLSTNGSGLKRYSPENQKFKTFLHDENQKDSINSNYIRMVHQDNQNRLWIATKGTGLVSLYDYKTETFKNHDFDINGKNIEWITDNGKNILFVGTRDGALNIVDLKNKVTKNIFFRKENGKIQKSSLIRVLFFEKESKLLWIGTEKGLYIYDTLKEKFLPMINGLQNMHIRTVFKDKTGLIWLGTLSNGLIKINKNSLPAKYLLYNKNDYNSLIDNVVWGIYEDFNKNLWISTTNGLTVFDKDYKVLNKYIHNDEDEHSMSESNATSILQVNENQIWMGTYGSGIEIFDIKNKKFTNINKDSETIKGLSSNYISKVFKDKDQNIWIGTYDAGINIYHNGKNEFEVIKDNKFSLSSNQIRDIIEDKDKNIWIATYGKGIFKYENKKFINYTKKFNNKALLIDNSIYSLAYDPKNNYIWGAGEGGYIIFDLNKNKFLELPYLKELNNKVLLGVVIDKAGNIWFSSGKGMYWVKQKEKKILLFDKKDGLLADEFNENAYFLKRDGTVCFGSKKGAVLINPDKIKINLKKPTIALTSIKIDRKNYKKNLNNIKEIDISYDNYIITFEFSVIDYLDPTKNTYQYKIPEINEEWSEFTTNNQLVFTSLKPGTYTLIVRGKNSKKIITSNKIKIKINVIPPFYKRKSFIISVILFFSFIGFIISRLRISAVKKRNKILEKKVKEKTKELYNTNKKLREMALTDPLTGLRNRHFFKVVLKEEIKNFINDKKNSLNYPENNTKNRNTVMGLFMVDLDFFKSVNDKYGHDSGDIVLKDLAEIFKNTTRGSDSIIRWGGEEFLIILKNCDIDYLDIYCKKLLDKVSNYEFKVLSGETVKKTCSVGYINFPPIPDKPDYINLEQAITIADLALYHAKNTGRNRGVRIAVKNTDQSNKNINEYIEDLNKALESNFLEIEKIIIGG